MSCKLLSNFFVTLNFCCVLFFSRFFLYVFLAALGILLLVGAQQLVSSLGVSHQGSISFSFSCYNPTPTPPLPVTCQGHSEGSNPPKNSSALKFEIWYRCES